MENQESNNKQPISNNMDKTADDKLDKEIIDQVEKMDLSDDKKETIISSIASLEMYSGPIPHPKILAGYDALDKGAAKKIIDNGIAESEHRRNLETSRQKRRGRMAWVSLIAVIVFIIITAIGTFYLAQDGHSIFATGTGLISFFTLVGTVSSNVETLSGNDDLTNNKDHDKNN
ncbi:DUF2335 domain-containing protein [Lactobacillus sp. ESL0679]|uniref:DUF2335 domain-containing protein n=1 Tax=Lactobacillus sp. ESL0679 TaxID=2983209 RepID=UPI0023F99DD9|nr:DUF2335 domain-containing protein [Lactobacillus sp. ESL0679]MDF7682523.1 DUF2335 domain-containing protein [Lactobacillus sp. ESL0679]